MVLIVGGKERKERGRDTRWRYREIPEVLDTSYGLKAKPGVACKQNRVSLQAKTGLA